MESPMKLQYLGMGEGILARDQFETCLLAGLCKVALRPVNYEKCQEAIQDKHETPYQFLECLPKAPHMCFSSSFSTPQTNFWVP